MRIPGLRAGSGWLAIRLLWASLAAGWGGCALGGEFRVAPERPDLDRWMYPFNFEPGSRKVAPTYGSFDSRFDTRDAEFLLGWDTASQVATQAGPARYLLRSVRVTLTSQAPGQPNHPFIYDPTYDSFRTYGTNVPDPVPDGDPGRPIEIYGAGFRGGFTADTFLENSSFGPVGAYTDSTISIGTRHAFAAMYDTNGVLIDIANHVGQLNADWTNAPFEVRPWGVGTTTNAAPGEEMPDGGRMTFEVDLTDPLILGYLQRSLHKGRLRLMVSSLSPAGQSTPGGTGAGGVGAYPWWATRESLIHDPPALEIEGVLVGSEDSEPDGLPDDWERFWYGDLTSVSAADDLDLDGATAAQEYLAGTDPRDGASVLRLRTWGLGEAGRLSLTFPVAASRDYLVETSGDMVGWTPLPGVLTYPSPGLGAWIEEASDGAGSRFVRILAR